MSDNLYTLWEGGDHASRELRYVISFNRNRDASVTLSIRVGNTNGRRRNICFGI